MGGFFLALLSPLTLHIYFRTRELLLETFITESWIDFLQKRTKQAEKIARQRREEFAGWTDVSGGKLFCALCYLDLDHSHACLNSADAQRSFSIYILSEEKEPQ